MQTHGSVPPVRGRAIGTAANWAVRIAEGVLRRREAGPLLGLAVMCVVFQSMSGNFLSEEQVGSALTLSASIGIVAIGVSFLMRSGEFDLSVGAVYGFTSVLFGKLLLEHHMNGVLALVLVLSLAAAIGVLNGIVTTVFGIPSFIATLAALFVIKGTALVVSGGDTVPFFEKNSVMSALGGPVGSGPIAAPLLWALGIVIVVWVLAEKTRYGNWASAAGARTGAARAMGVPVKRVKIINFAICSTLAAFAGITQFANYGATASTSGQDYELLAIVATVVGGTSLFGVTGTIVGTAVGALMLGVLQTGLVLVGAPGSWYTAMVGVILVLAVILNVQLGRLDLRRVYNAGFSRFNPSAESGEVHHHDG